MADQRPSLTLLQRREIEAQIVGPLIRGFSDAFGREATLDVLRNVIVDLARKSGADLARALGEQSLEAFATSLDRWKEDDALEFDLIESTPDRLSFNVIRCRYAEMYRRLGLEDLGSTLSCQRDFALSEGFSPDIHLNRTQTLMQGASHCDFRFRREPDGDASG